VLFTDADSAKFYRSRSIFSSNSIKTFDFSAL